MAKYIHIERVDYHAPVAHVFKVKGTELAFACQDALAQLRAIDMHAISFERQEGGAGLLVAAPARYVVRWATIREWRAGGEK